MTESWEEQLIPQMIESRFKIILTSYNTGPKPQDEIPQGYMQSSVFRKTKSMAQVYKPSFRPVYCKNIQEFQLVIDGSYKASARNPASNKIQDLNYKIDI